MKTCCGQRWRWSDRSRSLRTFTVRDCSFGAAFSFLGIEVNLDRLEEAIHFSRFENLAAQEAEKGFRERPGLTQRFFRKGKVGDWQYVLSSDHAKRIIDDHGAVMRRFGYLDDLGLPTY